MKKTERKKEHHIVKDLYNTLAHGTVPLRIAEALLGTFCGKFLNST